MSDVSRTDPAFMKFLAARDRLTAYEQSSKDRSSPEYKELVAAFKFADTTAANAQWSKKA
jgi:hypothetical protein